MTFTTWPPVCADGEVRAIVRKQVLPNYGVFDERRYFAPGEAGRTALFDLGGQRWSGDDLRGRLEPFGPGRPPRQGGAELDRVTQRLALPRRHLARARADARHAGRGRRAGASST